MPLLALEAIQAAARTIEGRVIRTPTVSARRLSESLGGPTMLKLEMMQLAGCFKPRGITNKLLSMSEAERAQGLLTVSGGNHGMALSTIARDMGLACTIFMPKTAPASSVARIRANGADVRLTEDVAQAFEQAEVCKQEGRIYIHSFDDPLIMAGHGTVGLEFIADAPALTDVLVSIGGGALIGGVASALKALKPGIRVWGVETDGADAMSRALAAGHPVPMTVTSISSTLGAPFVTARTLAHTQARVDEVMRVSDADAVAGVLQLAEDAKVWVEPAAGCLVPAARRVRERVGPDAVLGLVLCGGNVSWEDVSGWVHRFGIRAGA